MKRFLSSLVSIIFVVLIARPASGHISSAWFEHEGGYFNLKDKMVFHSNFAVYGLEGKKCCLEIRIADQGGNIIFEENYNFTPNDFDFARTNYTIGLDYDKINFKERGIYYLLVKLIGDGQELERKDAIPFTVVYDENAEYGHRFEVSPVAVNLKISNIEYVNTDFLGYYISYEGESYSPIEKNLKVFAIVEDAKARDRGERRTVGIVGSEKRISKGLDTKVRGDLIIRLDDIALDYSEVNDIEILVAFYDSDEKSDNKIIVGALTSGDICVPISVEEDVDLIFLEDSEKKMTRKARTNKAQTKKPATSTNVPTKSRRKGH